MIKMSIKNSFPHAAVKYTAALFLIFCLFVIPVSAFTDDFNDNDMTDWLIGSGVWSTKNTSSILGVNDYYAFSDFTSTPPSTTTNTEYVTQTTENFVFFEFDVRQKSDIITGTDHGPSMNAYTRVYFSNTDYFQMRHSGTARQISFTGFTYTPINYVDGAWYHVEMSFYDNNNIKIDIYKDDILINSQTSSYVNPNHNIIKLYSINADNEAYVSGHYIVLESAFDNIRTSDSLTPTINGVKWQSIEYTVGDQGKYQWSVSDSFWTNLLYSYSVVVIKDNTQVKFSKVAKSGTGYYNFDKVGEYTVKLQYAPVLSLKKTWTGIDTDVTRVYDPYDSSIYVKQTVAAGVAFDIEYSYGYTPAFPKIIYQVFENGKWDYIPHIKDISQEENKRVTTYYTTDSLSRIGDHRIILADDAKGEVASIVFKVIFVNRPPEQNVTSSKITVDNSILYWGEFATGTYKVDNYNYSNYLIRIDTYDEDFEYIINSVPLNNQVGTYYTDYIRTAGNKTLQLIAYNVTNNKVAILDSVNISVTETTTGGYSLRTNTDTVRVNQEYTVFIVSPGVCQLVVYQVDSVIPYETFELSGSTTLNLIAPAEPGKMKVWLRDSAGKVVITKTMNVIGADDIIGDPIIDEPTTTLLDTFLSSTMFIVLVIVLTCAGLLSSSMGGVGALIGLCFGVVVCVVMGYLAVWVLILMALGIAGLFATGIMKGL